MQDVALEPGNDEIGAAVIAGPAYGAMRHVGAIQRPQDFDLTQQIRRAPPLDVGGGKRTIQDSSTAFDTTVSPQGNPACHGIRATVVMAVSGSSVHWQRWSDIDTARQIP